MVFYVITKKTPITNPGVFRQIVSSTPVRVRAIFKFSTKVLR